MYNFDENFICVFPESAQQMNERLRNELLELEGEIRNQSQLNTPQDGRYELR